MASKYAYIEKGFSHDVAVITTSAIVEVKSPVSTDHSCASMTKQGFFGPREYQLSKCVLSVEVCASVSGYRAGSGLGHHYCLYLLR